MTEEEKKKFKVQFSFREGFSLSNKHYAKWVRFKAGEITDCEVIIDDPFWLW